MPRRDAIEILSAIREWENATSKPRRARMTYVDPDGKIRLKGGFGKVADQAAYAEKCREWMRYADDVDAVTLDLYEPLDMVVICETPAVLEELGFDGVPLTYIQRHLRDAMREPERKRPRQHGLGIGLVKSLPEFLERPVMVCDSPRRADAAIVVLAAVDRWKNPIMVAVTPEGKGNYGLREIRSNHVLSVYGKRNFADYYEGVVTPGRCVYYDRERAKELEALAELRLFRCHPRALNGIIRQPECLQGRSNPESAKDARGAGRGGRASVPQTPPESLPKPPGLASDIDAASKRRGRPAAGYGRQARSR